MSAKQTNGAAKGQTQQAAKQTKEETVRTAKAGAETAQSAAKTGAEAAEAVYAEGKDNLGKAFDAGNQAIFQGFEQMMGIAREQVGRYYPDAAKNFDDVAAVQKGNIDALFAMQAAATKGAEAIGQEIYNFQKKAFDSGFETFKKVLEAKTVQDAVEVQTGFARTQFEEIVSESAKLSELTVRTGKDAVEPLSARVSETVGRALKQTSA